MYSFGNVFVEDFSYCCFAEPEAIEVFRNGVFDVLLAFLICPQRGAVLFQFILLAGVCGGVIVQWRFVLVGRMNHLLEKKCW